MENGSSSSVKAFARKQQPKHDPIPLEVLKMLGAYLEPGDLAAARLACHEWREQLSAQVQAVKLPTYLWQYCVPGQLVALYRLVDSFRHLQEVKLKVVSEHPVDSWSMGRATDTLRMALPTLRRLQLSSIMQPGHWRAALVSLQCVAPQLTALEMLDMCWPPTDTLHLLSSLSSLQHLAVTSPHFSRLEPDHLDAISRLQQLQQLSLCFRTVDGTANEPLSMDALSALVRLTHLEVHYTGLLELASSVVFCSPSALSALSNLRSLNVSIVPMPSLAALCQLPQLSSLVLQQAQPLSGSQCIALARCKGLAGLSLSSVQWADLPRLAPLTGLTALSLQVWQPMRGSLPGSTAGQQLLHLKHLSGLKQFQLKGQCELPAELLLGMAAHWQSLTRLDLCCMLPNGTLGLQQFTALRSLKLQPYKWDVWSSEPPVLLYPSLLPTSLTELQALDVWCLDEMPTTSSNTSGSGGGGMQRSSSYCSITGILTGMASVGRDLCNLGGATAAVTGSSGLCSMEEIVLGNSRGAKCDKPSCSSWDGPPAGSGAQQQEPQQQALPSILLLQTPQLRRLVLRSTSPFDRRLLMPDLSMCSQLEDLELHHSQLNQCHIQHIAACCPSSLRSLKLVAVDDGARIRSSGLTVLTRLSALTNLSVHAHERAINKNVRRAIASMSQLRNLTLLTSPDYPSAFARNLACLTQLTNLMVLRVGLGFGALDALRRLGTHVQKSLPHCSYQMLTDGCME